MAAIIHKSKLGTCPNTPQQANSATKKNAIAFPVNQSGIVNSPFRGGAAAASIPNRSIHRFLHPCGRTGLICGGGIICPIVG